MNSFIILSLLISCLLLVSSKKLEVEKRVEAHPVVTEALMVKPVPRAKAGLLRGHIVC